MPPKRKAPKRKMTVAQQRMLYHSLPAVIKLGAKKKCLECQMKGDGLMSIIKSVGKSLGKLGKEIGPTVLKEIIAPILVSKYKQKGKGLTLPGGGLTLPGGAIYKGKPATRRRITTLPVRHKRK